MIRSDRFDRAFIEEVMAEPGGEHLLTCWSCGTCAATCLVRRFDSAFNPRVVLRKAGLGLREETLSSPEIWQCSACDACYPRCPKEIHISDVMTAIRALAIREGYEAPGPFPVVDEQVCSGCAVCTRACPYEAMQRVELRDGRTHAVARTDQNLCMHCGVCVAACPSQAISLEALNDTDILARATAGGWLGGQGFLDRQAGQDAATKVVSEPRILAFVCQWSLRADSEWQRLDALGERVRVVNLPCSGRVDPEIIIHALAHGADGVLVVGCKEGECHYQRGTYQGRAKVRLLGSILGELGAAADRVRFVELGALDRHVLAGLVGEMTERTRAAITPAPA